MADDPETKKLDPYSIAPGDSTVRFHRNRDPRFYASIGFDRGNYDVQGKTIVLKCRRGEMQQNNAMPRMSIKRTTVIIVRNGCLNMIPIIGLPIK